MRDDCVKYKQSDSSVSLNRRVIKISFVLSRLISITSGSRLCAGFKDWNCVDSDNNRSFLESVNV